MTKLSTKVRKAGYTAKHQFFTFDNILVLVAAVFCLVWTGGSIASMSRNWELAEEVAARQREKALLELEIETMELENVYYHTAEYQELAARKYQNKLLAGETMVYLPDNSEAAKNKHKQETTLAQETTTEVSNLTQWLTFLFGA